MNAGPTPNNGARAEGLAAISGLAGTEAARVHEGPFGNPLDSLFTHLDGLKLPPPSRELIERARSYQRDILSHIRGADEIAADLAIELQAAKHGAESRAREATPPPDSD